MFIQRKSILIAIHLPKQICIIERDTHIARRERHGLFQIAFCRWHVVEAGFNQCAQAEIIRSRGLIRALNSIENIARAGQFFVRGSTLINTAI